MPQVFISYSRKDLAFVERLVRDLKAAGLEVWYDLSGLEPGERWGKEIQSAIRESKYFLVVLSPNSIDSEWVEREFIYASGQKIKVVPILLRECELPMWVLNRHIIDLSGRKYAQNIGQLLKTLGMEKAPVDPGPQPNPSRPEPASQRTSAAPGDAARRKPSLRALLIAGFSLLIVGGIAIAVWLMGNRPENYGTVAPGLPLNVRTAPYLNADLLGVLQQNDTVEILGASPDGEWLLIRYGDGTGWVMASFVEFAADAIPTVASVPTADPTPAGTPASSDQRTREQDGMTEIYIPADTDGRTNPEAYWIDQTEVTNAMFLNFLNGIVAGVRVSSKGLVTYNDETIYDLECLDCPNWVDRITWDGARFSAVSEYEDHPASLVSWYGAKAYCEWAGGRLPTEAEWQYAAQGRDGREYPWGNVFDCGKGNFDDETVVDSYVVSGGPNCDGYPTTSPVGSFQSGASPFGALDMSGNVWEWTGSMFDDSEYVLRGGSWSVSGYNLRIFFRDWHDIPSATWNNNGFRCVRPATP